MNIFTNTMTLAQAQTFKSELEAEGLKCDSPFCIFTLRGMTASERTDMEKTANWQFSIEAHSVEEFEQVSGRIN